MGDTVAWDSVEIATLTVDALVPLSVALLGVAIARASRRYQRREWINQKLIERRITMIDNLAPGLNQLYCYFVFRGEWSTVTPLQVIMAKRTLDRMVFGSLPYLAPETVESYLAFMDALFQTYRGPGLPPRLRTTILTRHGDRSALLGGSWDASWRDLFVEPNDATPRSTVRTLYNSLLNSLGASIGADASGGVPPLSVQPGRADGTGAPRAG